MVVKHLIIGMLGKLLIVHQMQMELDLLKLLLGNRMLELYLKKIMIGGGIIVLIILIKLNYSQLKMMQLE